MPMTSDAKSALSRTIRPLRTRLLEDLHAATETAYRLSVRPQNAGLDETPRTRRARLEAWIAEQLRAQEGAGVEEEARRTGEDFRSEVETQAAYTLLNRLVILRLMEADEPGRTPLREPTIVTGGWESRGYLAFRELAPALVRGDDTEGYAFLLQLAFEDLATELPGVFGSAGVADLVPVPPATLRHVIEALDADELESCWTDDMTLGWVYQYWNDPERERIDAKLNAGGKVAPHEIASKTQMFTERYMVDWLLQNSLGPMWLSLCKKHGWAPEVETDGTLERLEARRVEWRARREAGEVPLTELIPLHAESERRWAYYVPQPVPEEVGAEATESVRDWKILDPAVGSGHFLVVALDLLLALYREEAKHRGEAGDPRWSDRAIVERVLSHNLHGIDLDPRAVQIAAAALWLKAQHFAPGARPERLNLVASNLNLASLPDDDPALVELRREVERETGLPGKLTDTIVHALRGADHLGTLLKIDGAVDEAISKHEAPLGRVVPEQGHLEHGFAPQQRLLLEPDAARESLLGRLETFLGKHTSADDLGLRLRGEQLATGVRFARMVREGTYDLVVANPPYQGTSKMDDAEYVEQQYTLGKADLYAAFLLRGLELVREGGVSAMLTMRNWMFIKQYAGLREHLLAKENLRGLHDLSSGAFEEISAAQVVVSVVSSVFERRTGSPGAVALKVFDDATVTNVGETRRKRAATLCHVGRHEFDPATLKVVPEWPLVYWWDGGFLDQYRDTPLVGAIGAVRQGLTTSNNDCFVRFPWENGSLTLRREYNERPSTGWVPYIKGARGVEWIEPASFIVDWRLAGLAIKVLNEQLYQSHTRSVRSEDRYFDIGSAFTTMGSRFGGRSHRFRSICDAKGRTVYGTPHAQTTCLLNSALARHTVESLNPTVDFSVGDVNRLPAFPIANANEIFAQIESAFTLHETHREPSVEFKHPGPSPWRHAQDWAQLAVDRPEGARLPEYIEELDPEPPTDHLSFALGVALGRFGGGEKSGGTGILDPETAALNHALPAGILFLDTTLDTADQRDSLGHPAAAPLHSAWKTHGSAIDTKRSLRDWLAVEFFKDVHKGMYENRPIHWPLSSEKKTFVAWVNIHRSDKNTLRDLLADQLEPCRARIDGELTDLRAARDGADAKAARAAETRLGRVKKASDELAAFIANVEQCAYKGPLPTDPKCPARARDARYAPDLDDGVMINSAALWKLLEPQWKDPKKWWKQLATAKGKKDYDWSHLAMRYWPKRVDEKCRKDPSLGVAHGCFWRYHPERAWAWELRLQDEIGSDFRIEEAPYHPGGSGVDKDADRGADSDTGDKPHRTAWLRDHATDALAAVEKEALRRMGRGKDKTVVPELNILEPGLWSALPEEVWTMEVRLSEKQKAEFHLRAPDEAEARAGFEAAHPKEVKARAQLIKELTPAPKLLADSQPDAKTGNTAVSSEEATP